MNGKTWVLKLGDGYISLFAKDDVSETTSERKAAERMTLEESDVRMSILRNRGISVQRINLADPITAFRDAVFYLLVRANRERKLSHMLIGSELYDKMIQAYALSYCVELPDMACMRSPADILDLVAKGRKS